MSLIERFRERHQEHQQQRQYDKPMKKKERAPFASKLLDEIDANVDATPEFQDVSIKRKIENRTTHVINSKPIEYDNSLGHFAIRKGEWTDSGLTYRGAKIDFTPINNAENKDDEELTIEVYHRALPPHNPGVTNEVYVWPPYALGGFSVKGNIPDSLGKKLVPNSHETLDTIVSLLTVLFPTPNRSKIVYRPNLEGFFPEQK